MMIALTGLNCRLVLDEQYQLKLHWKILKKKEGGGLLVHDSWSMTLGPGVSASNIPEPDIAIFF